MADATQTTKFPPECPICKGSGEIDERIGGINTSSIVPCPDCENIIEDACTDCDDTGITIQTERRCLCRAGIEVAEHQQMDDDQYRSTLSA